MLQREVRAYLLSGDSVHKIRESLQIILDFAEYHNSEPVINQVHRIMEEIAGQRISAS